MRRVLAAVGVAALCAGLVGCGGIPTSGDVREGVVIDEQDAPDFGYDPSGPQDGATPEEIVTGFIQAATSPQDDYAIARSFLTSSLADEWEPNATTQVRAGAGVTQGNTDGTLSYVFSSSAYVDNLGTLFTDAPSTQRLDFGLVQGGDGEWRIGTAPDGIVLSSEGFDTIFDHYPLYYFDSSYAYLVPDVRWFPRTTRLNTRLVLTLLSGQSPWLAQGITNSEFPTGTTLESAVTTESGVATVDLSEAVRDATPQAQARMAEQLKNTLGVSSVVITVNGVEIDIPDSESVPVVNPSVEGSLLARTDDGFGYLSSRGTVTGLAGQSAEILALDASAVVLSRNREFSAVRSADGVHIVFADNSDQMLLDARPGLLASTDASGFVWTVPENDGAAVRVFDTAGARYDIVAPILAGSRVASFEISRDGSRLAVYTATESGPRLAVYGILRTDGVPYALGPPLEVRTDQGLTPIDAAWVDDRTIATLSSQPTSTSTSASVTLHELGGQNLAIGRVVSGKSIVGTGTPDGLRVLGADGEVYQQRRGAGWAATGITVSFLATQQ